MVHIKIIQREDSPQGSCDVFLNDTVIDSVDNNFEKRFTQGHIALAKLYKKYGQFDSISFIPAKGCPKPYPLKILTNMAIDILHHYKIRPTSLIKMRS